jgi:protein-disulfide isomerase
MKPLYKIILLVEIQLILILLIISMFRINSIDNKVYNTNKFVHEVMLDNRKDALNTIRDTDISIGDQEAPLTMFLYTRFDCQACNDFFLDNYNLLMTEFVNTGLVQLVIRYMVHPTKPNTLYATKSAHYLYGLGNYDLFIERSSAIFPAIDTLTIHNVVSEITNEMEEYYINGKDKKLEQNLLDLAKEIRNANILYTPTVIINGQQLIGSRRYEKLKEIIINSLGDNYCE